MSLNTWMICGLALYVCFVIYVGFLGAKKIKGLSDFAVAGESMGPIPLGLAFAASFFSAATFMGYVGFCYAWGSTGMWIFLAIFCASTLGFILLAKGVRNSNVELKSISMADWLAKRYNSDVLRGLCSIVFIIQIFYIAGQFSAGGSLLSGMIDGLDYTTAIIGVTIITVLYVTVGGLFADVYTSIGQMCLMIFAGVFVFVSGLMLFKGGLILVITTCISNDLFLPKIANSKAAIIGAIVGEGVYFYLYLIAHIERSVMAAGAWGVLVSFVVMFVLGSLWKSDLPEAQAQK